MTPSLRAPAAAAAALLVLALAAACGADDLETAGGGAGTSTGAGGGTGSTISGETLPVPPTTTLDDQELDLGDLDDARARWEAVGRERYRVDVRRSCFCPVEYLGPFVVTVVRGEVRKVVMGEGAAAAEPPADIQDQALTVEQVFDLIEETIAQGGTADVIYEEETGVPTRAALDPIPDAVDDETLIELDVLGDR